MAAKKQALVVYYSVTGNTARVARDLAARLDADLESIQDRTHGVGFLGYLKATYDAWRKAPAPIGAVQYDPSEYSVTVIGTPVWVWQMTPAVRAYLHRMTGRTHNVAFFITSGDTQVEKIIPSLEAQGECKAVASTGFNARELGDALIYEQKLAAFVEAVKRAYVPLAPGHDSGGRVRELASSHNA